MGNIEVIPRGGVQFTSAGSGLSHSEYNHSHTKPVHFLQMWVYRGVLLAFADYSTSTPNVGSRKGLACIDEEAGGGA
jgi:hypothetical protein